MSRFEMSPQISGNSHAPHIGHAEGMSDDEIAEKVRAQLAAEGRKKDVELVIVNQGQGRSRVIALGADQNPWGFDVSDLFGLGYIPLPIRGMEWQDVQWDEGRAEWAGEEDGPYFGGRKVIVGIERLESRGGDDSAEDDGPWAVIVNGHIGGITDDPGILGRAKRGEITNLDGLTFPAPRIVPMRRDIAAEALVEIEASESTVAGSASVDSGQVMISDATLVEKFDKGDMGRRFDPADNSFTYAGACSQTLHDGGTLILDDAPVAAASSSGYGDGEYPVIRLDRDDPEGPADSLLVDYGVVDLRRICQESVRADDLGTFRLGTSTRAADPCYFRHPPEDGLGADVETVPGLYRACAIRQSDGERRTAALLVYRIGD